MGVGEQEDVGEWATSITIDLLSKIFALPLSSSSPPSLFLVTLSTSTSNVTVNRERAIMRSLARLLEREREREMILE